MRPLVWAAGTRFRDGPATSEGAGWITAIAPIAFSFDGWTVSASISSEVRRAKRNVPLALVIAPACILLLYILYFAGIFALSSALKP